MNNESSKKWLENWSNYGWVCPICGRVLAPWMGTCPWCNEELQKGDTCLEKPWKDDTIC